ncbi:MAG: hypothetical protein GY869_07405 [Planctomycetes bacterium]|nr:hypothetical protein [Planctomycetota bacterium]
MTLPPASGPEGHIRTGIILIDIHFNQKLRGDNYGAILLAEARGQVLDSLEIALGFSAGTVDDKTARSMETLY